MTLRPMARPHVCARFCPLQARHAAGSLQSASHSCFFFSFTVRSYCEISSAPACAFAQLAHHRFFPSASSPRCAQKLSPKLLLIDWEDKHISSYYQAL
jgi:hypothetical protein